MPKAARLGDIGSSGVFIDGKPTARLGDAIDCGGTILSASPDVVIG